MRTFNLSACVCLLFAAMRGWAHESTGPTINTAIIRDSEPDSDAKQAEPNTDPDAAQAFWRGKEFYDAGEFSLAIEQFQLAFAATHEPSLLYDIAQSYRRLNQCQLALENYRSFLRIAPKSPLAAQAEKQASALQTSCKSASVAAPATPSEPNRAPIVTQPSTLPNQEQKSKAPKPQDDPARSSPSPSVGWTVAALSGAVILGGVAAGLEIWNDGRYSDWRTRDQNLARGTQDGSRLDWAARQQANDNLAHSIERVDRSAAYLSVGAGALLATAVALYWWPRGEKSSRKDRLSSQGTEPTHATRVSLQLGGVIVAGSF